MKRTTPPLAAFVVIALLSHGRAASVDFNTYTSPTDNDLVNNFQLNQNGSGSTPFSQVTTGGITGGYVSIDPSSYGWNGVYTGQSFSNSTGNQLSLSAYFKFSSSAFQSSSWWFPLRLGWLTSTSSIVESAPNMAYWVENAIGDDLTKFRIQVVFTDGTGSSIGHFNESGKFDLEDGHWYQLSTSLTNLGGQSYDVSAVLSDHGTSGSASPSVIGSTDYVADSTHYFTSDFSGVSAVYAAFNAQGPGGVVGVDNFSANVEEVPEPSTCAMLAMGGTALLFQMRQRRRV